MGIDFQKGNKVTFVDGLGGKLGIPDGGIAVVEKEIMAAIGNAKEQGCRVLLVLDGLDFLLAATSVGAMEVLDMVSELREVDSLLHDETTSKKLLIFTSPASSCGHRYGISRLPTCAGKEHPA